MLKCELAWQFLSAIPCKITDFSLSATIFMSKFHIHRNLPQKIIWKRGKEEFKGAFLTFMVCWEKKTIFPNLFSCCL